MSGPRLIFQSAINTILRTRSFLYWKPQQALVGSGNHVFLTLLDQHPDTIPIQAPQITKCLPCCPRSGRLSLSSSFFQVPGALEIETNVADPLSRRDVYSKQARMKTNCEETVMDDNGHNPSDEVEDYDVWLDPETAGVSSLLPEIYSHSLTWPTLLELPGFTRS